jgi:pyruvate-formate lyase
MKESELMNKKLKEALKKYFKDTRLWQFRSCVKINSVYLNKILTNKKYIIKLKTLYNTKAIYKYKGKTKIDQLKNLFNKIKYDTSIHGRFYYSLDTNAILYSNNLVLGNMPLNYEKVVNLSLNELRVIGCNNAVPEIMRKQNSDLLDLVDNIIYDIIQNLKMSDSLNRQNIVSWFERMKDEKAESLEEALQRILFWNQLLWQTKHKLNGLGRLDQILINFCQETNYKDSVILDILKDFLSTLHLYFPYKSNALMGDTGQIIILGGTDINGNYQSNRLTYLFIEAVKELNLPDPKLLLRVSSKTPKDLMKVALKCISTGIGCPILSNDDVIIPKLIDFGYQKEDAYNYVTAACWEPVIPGKSSDQNNLYSINFISPLNNTLLDTSINSIGDMDSFISLYKTYLKLYIHELLLKLDIIEYEPDPIFSLLSDDCSVNGKDIADGGARYNNYGLLTVGVSNAVNSLMNIEKYVFKTKRFTLEQLRDWQEQNFVGNYNIEKLFKSEASKFGCDNDKVINLTNELMGFVEDNLKGYRNKFGGKLKFGFSSPQYLDAAVNTKASFDGRLAGQPFNVNISNPQGIPYTELVSFAGKLDYSGIKFNGNVVDYIVSPSFVNNNFDKLVEFLISSVKIGFFEMQMNVVSYETLVKAKAHPEDYPGLIVRVWGFSAYFNDLPEEYKDVLTKRAKESEHAA